MTDFKINCGGGAVSHFIGDAYFSGGGTQDFGNGFFTIDKSGVSGPAPNYVYDSFRNGNFTYMVSGLTPGETRKIRIHSHENYYTSAGNRLFSVAVNGAGWLTNYDVFAVAGAINKAVVAEGIFTADGSGIMTIAFTSGTGGQICGIEINEIPPFGIEDTSPLVGGSVDSFYSETFSTVSGAGDQTWTVISGSLPPGMALAASTGILAGMPSAPGTYSFTVQCIDTVAGTTSKAFLLTINAEFQITDLPAGLVDLWFEPRLGGIKNASGDDALDGQKVATIQDLSGSGFHLTQSDNSKRMTYVASSDYAGLPAIKNVGGYMFNSTWNGWDNKTSQCWFVAMRAPGIGVVIGGVVDGQQCFQIAQNFSGGDGFFNIGSNEPAGCQSLGNNEGGQLLTAIHDGSLPSTGSARYKFIRNKVVKTLGAPTFPIPATLHTVGLGVSLGGSPANPSETSNGEFYFILHLTAAPTSQQLADITAYAERYFALAKTKSRVICEGDSRSKGYTEALIPNRQKSYPYKLAKKLNGNSIGYDGTAIDPVDLHKRWLTTNEAQEGDRMTFHILPQAPGIYGKRDEWLKNDIICLWAGINDLSIIAPATTSAYTGVEIETAMHDYCDLMRDRGFKVIIATEIGDGADNEDFTQRDIMNARILAYWETYADGLIRPELTGLADGTDDDLFDDTKVHLREAGNEIMAQLFFNEIISLITAILNLTLPDAGIGIYYNETVNPVGAAPLNLAVTSGSLPPGMSLDPLTGAITGTPTAFGSHTFTVSLIDGDGKTDFHTFTINVVNQRLQATVVEAVAQVSFFAGNILLGTAKIPPFRIEWDPALLPSGIYDLRAEAIDPAGNVGVSNLLTFEVDN